MKVRDCKGINSDYLIQIERHDMKLQTTNLTYFFIKRVLQDCLCLVSAHFICCIDALCGSSIAFLFWMCWKSIHYYCGNESVALWVLLNAKEFFLQRPAGYNRYLLCNMAVSPAYLNNLTWKIMAREKWTCENFSTLSTMETFSKGQLTL